MKKLLKKLSKGNIKSIVFITVLGFLIRLVFLGQHDFWFDEAFSYFIAKLPISNLLAATAADNNPPFYYLLIKFFLFFGNNSLYLRFIPLIFGVLSIPLVYKLSLALASDTAQAQKFVSLRQSADRNKIAKDLKREENIAILSSLIFSLSPLTVYFSTETRMYQLLVFETLLFVFLFLKLFKKKDRILQTLFVTVGVLGIYTHYYFILPMFLLFLFGVFKKQQRKNFLFWFLIFVVIGLAFLPWSVFYLSYQQHPGCWCFSPVIGIPATLASFFINGVGFVTFRDFLQLPVFKLVLLLGVAGIFLFSFLVGIIQKRKAGLGEFLLIGSFIIVSVISFIGSSFSPRSFIIFAPFFYMVTGEGIYFLTKSLKRSFLVVIVLLGATLILFLTDSTLRGQPIKQSALYIERGMKEGDVISHSSVYTFYSYRYYLGEKNLQFLNFPSELSEQTVYHIGGSATGIKEAFGKGKRVWLVNIPIWSSEEDVWKAKNYGFKNYKLIEYKQFGEIEVLLFDTSSVEK